MNLCSIASGSSGNCIYVGTDSTHILVDAGISGKRITAGLESIQVPPSELSAILITHEHSDHIQGLGVMARKYHIPIYATVETFHAIFHQKNVGKIAEELVHPIEPDYEFRVGDMEIHPFAIYHDAANPV